MNNTQKETPNYEFLVPAVVVVSLMLVFGLVVGFTYYSAEEEEIVPPLQWYQKIGNTIKSYAVSFYNLVSENPVSSVLVTLLIILILGLVWQRAWISSLFFGSEKTAEKVVVKAAEKVVEKAAEKVAEVPVVKAQEVAKVVAVK